MTVEHNPAVVGTRRDRGQARHEAAGAIRLAARSLAVQPDALGAAAYRGFCAREENLNLPSWLAISLLFAGWQRACEQVAALTDDEAAVEANVVYMLYGDPSRRQLVYATVGREQAVQPGSDA